MPYTQFSQNNLSYFLCDTHKTLGENGLNLTKNELESSETVDDILSRMDRLRSLASMQRKKSKSNKRQQYSFCF